MTTLYIYPNQKFVEEALLSLYDCQRIGTAEHALLILRSSFIDDPKTLVSNLVLDFSINVKILFTNTSHPFDSTSVLTFLKQQPLGSYGISDYLFHCLVFQQDEALCNMMRNKIIQLDYEERNTLHTYIKNNGNTMKSAKELYVHRNTMTYRLHKLEQHFDLELNEAKSIHALAYLLVALKI
ncbi:PucR-like helix-turn-helix protein [Breznakia blatticola]|uniref:PucR-like helix-turn-helix protein n=1 Tax=Breznakia blatticola TaxID=1754012 RepID=A0A4V3G939_9FIRM|nr:helix-turn-helix domain-containing protein [Breznakia blatticola]TDW25334.1 PucR-like helix-turn-helix protein [Breznakia blatticola]